MFRLTRIVFENVVQVQVLLVGSHTSRAICHQSLLRKVSSELVSPSSILLIQVTQQQQQQLQHKFSSTTRNTITSSRSITNPITTMMNNNTTNNGNTNNTSLNTSEQQQQQQQQQQIVLLPVEAAIQQNLITAFQPTHLQIINESYRHNVPKNSETHFKVIIVSNNFNKCKSLLERHRMVNNVLQEQLVAGAVHALSIVAKTPEQWEIMKQQNIAIPSSPNCLGGDGTLNNK